MNVTLEDVKDKLIVLVIENDKLREYITQLRERVAELEAGATEPDAATAEG